MNGITIQEEEYRHEHYITRTYRSLVQERQEIDFSITERSITVGTSITTPYFTVAQVDQDDTRNLI